MSMFAWIRAAALLGFVIVATDFEPARFLSGDLPAQPLMVVGRGQVLLELHLDAAGSVTNVVPLRSTPPFTDLLANAAREWQFTPARETDGEPPALVAIETRVLVAGLFRPPTTYDTPSRGEVPEDVASASEEVPFPTTIAPPLYPPTAPPHLGAVVLVEVEVGEDGTVDNSRSIRSPGGFESVSTDAARQWKFRPARRAGSPVRSFAYIVFGFRDPVTSPLPTPR